jgi:hypothetical protein
LTSICLAALNILRLGLALPWWRPVAVAAGYLLLEPINSLWLDSLLVSLALLAAALALLWHLDVAP